MTDDLVTRLRDMTVDDFSLRVTDEAADEITRLRQENEKLQQQVEFLLEQIRKIKNDNP